MSKTITAKGELRQDLKALTSAPPPLHSVALLGFFLAFFLYQLPSFESLDKVATVETFTSTLFMTPQTVGYIRAAIAISIWSTSLYLIFSGGWFQETTYLPGSKLKRVPNRLVGIKTMFPFTSWSWNFLGAAFTASAYISLTATIRDDTTSTTKIHPWILRSALLLWEIAAPFTLLVAAVIRYAIWPGVLKAKGKTENLKHPRNIMMHNMNVVFALTEAALLGGLPVELEHLSMAPLVGCAYVLFSWSMTARWNEPEHGPQFIYFFFDTTLGVKASIALLVLLAVLMVFYMLFCFIEEILVLVDGGIIAHAAFVVLVSSTVMRFRD